MPPLNLVQDAPVRGMFVGRKIKIKGRSNRLSLNRDRFDINLEYRDASNTSNETILLHITTRFEHGCIIRNTFKQGNWGPEERYGNMPLCKDQPFTIEVECKPLVFSICINGSHFCDYKHRLPYNLVNFVSAHGDIEVQGMFFSETPQWWCNEPTTLSKGLAYETTAPSMIIGRKIRVQGRNINNGSRRFDIHFVSRSLGQVDECIPLLVAVVPSDRCIVRNSYTKCDWMTEERDGGMPLNCDQPFTIEVECKPHTFEKVPCATCTA